MFFQIILSTAKQLTELNLEFYKSNTNMLKNSILNIWVKRFCVLYLEKNRELGSFSTYEPIWNVM